MADGLIVASWNRFEFADVLAEFLEVAIHQIMYVREVYPRESFTRRKKYDTPVQMSRLPQVHEYICGVVTNLKAPLASNALDKVMILIMDDKGMPIERFVFEVDLGEEDVITYDPMDLQKEFCSFLLKISMAEAYQMPLPEGSTWALMVETKEPMPGGEHWLKTDLPSEGAAILPLKSGLLTKHKMQLFIETFAP